MEFKLSGFYEVMSPRFTALISTTDGQGKANAAPFSFVTPVSSDPPLLMFAATPARHTLANARETGDFVVNVVPEALLDRMWLCAKAFPKGVSEIEQAGLTERKSRLVTSPSIEECAAWVECRLEFEREAGDHIMVVGRVVHAEAKDEFVSDGKFDVSKANPILHIRGKRFVAAERIIHVADDER